jgi:phage/plasmid-like protein (TIGR03299 family)
MAGRHDQRATDKEAEMPAEVESMAFVGNRGLPWWIGTTEDRGQWANVDDLQTGEQMREVAGLTWEVQKQPIYAGRKKVRVAGKYATVRQDTGAPLGVVGEHYRVVQNAELDGWGDALVDSGEAKYETAGSLREGAVVFYSMELNAIDLKIKGSKLDETVKTYLLLTNSHDGSKALEALISPVRVVCMNTLNMAIGQRKAYFRMRHTGSMEGKIAAARQALGITFNYLEGFKELAEGLSLKRVVDAQVEEILRSAVWPTQAETVGQLAQTSAGKAMQLYQSSPTLEGIRGTAWGVLNAVAEYADHEASFKSRGVSTVQDIRANSILWGEAHYAKDRAVKALVEL